MENKSKKLKSLKMFIPIDFKYEFFNNIKISLKYNIFKNINNNK